MKLIRKLFGLTPNVGDYVKGYIDYSHSVKYEGKVIEVRNDEIMPGVIVDGVKTITTDWNGDIVTNEPRIFVPMSRVAIV
jgi:hypothetical protein